MTAKVDREICIGCGLCIQICSEVFRMEDDKAVVFVALVPKAQEGSCSQAAEQCPVTAIIVEM